MTGTAKNALIATLGFIAGYPLLLLLELIAAGVLLLAGDIGEPFWRWFQNRGFRARTEVSLVGLVPLLSIALLSWKRWRPFALGLLAFISVVGVLWVSWLVRVG